MCTLGQQCLVFSIHVQVLDRPFVCIISIITNTSQDTATLWFSNKDIFCLFPLDSLVLYFEQNDSVIVICGEYRDYHGHVYSGSSSAQNSTVVSSNRKTHKLVCALSISLSAYVMSSIQPTVHYYNKLHCLRPYTIILWEEY